MSAGRGAEPEEAVLDEAGDPETLASIGKEIRELKQKVLENRAREGRRANVVMIAQGFFGVAFGIGTFTFFDATFQQLILLSIGMAFVGTMFGTLVGAGEWEREKIVPTIMAILVATVAFLTGIPGIVAIT